MREEGERLSVKEEGSVGELGSDQDLDPDPWKMLWIRIRIRGKIMRILWIRIRIRNTVFKISAVKLFIRTDFILHTVLVHC